MRILALILSLLLISFISCQKELKFQLTQDNEVITQENQKLSNAITSQKQKTFLNGYIVNEQGQAIDGAAVVCGDKTVITDAKGFFYFKEVLNVNKDYALITVSKSGFKKGFRTFTPNRNSVVYHTEKIMLQAQGLSQSVPAAGGTITADGIKLTFSANSIVKAGGYAYTDNIQVNVRYINPAASGFPLMMPGMLSGLNTNGEIKALESFGMANVELTDLAGNKLEIASGKTVKMEMPAPTVGPATIPLWHFNEKYGIWVQQGIATKVGNVYVAEVNHFSIWNIDLEFNFFEVNLKFQTSPTTPVANLRVDVYRANNAFIKTFFTDNSGEGTLINCPSNEALTLKVVYACDTLIKTLAPVTQNRTEIITLSAANLRTYTLTGTLNSCSNQPLANQPFQVFLSNVGNFQTLNGVSDIQGKFNLTTLVPVCQVSGPLNAQTTAYFNNQYYFSNYKIIVPGINNYTPQLCDTINSNQAFNDSEVVNIPDPVLQQKVRQVINKPTGPIYYINVKNLKSLKAFGLGIQSMTGLQYFTGLDTIIISGNQIPITNIDPLATLINLKVLQLPGDSSGNQIADLRPLENLHMLEVLNLENCHITDITPLQSVISLRRLTLRINQISNIPSLQNLTKLEFLSLEINQITDITGIQNLPLLESLSLNHNQISNISSLQNLPSLKVIFLGYNQISNITPLQNLLSLGSVEIYNNQIADITPLQNLRSLLILNLSDNKVSNINPLQNLDSLTDLRLHNNLITTIQVLINKMPDLTQFSIIFGNTVPPSEIAAMRASHPNCWID